MNALSSARLSRLWTILIPLTILVGCGDGDGPTRIVNEPAAPYDGPPASCFEALSFEDICGFSYDFTEFEGGPGTIVLVADEPLIAGNAGNTSDKVVKAIKARNPDPAITFGGFVLTVGSPPAPFTISASSTITIKVWAQRPVNVLLEPAVPAEQGGGAGSGDEVGHGGTGWEELTFDLNYSGTTPGFVFIFDNGTNGNFAEDPDNWTFYIDDITLVEDSGGPVGAPTTSAPTPTQDAANVISLYSDAYTDIAVTWPTSFSAVGSVSDVTIDGGLVKEHLGVGFVGVEFASLDVSGMTHFHMDVWTPDADSLLVKLVDFGGDGFGGGNDSEGPITFDSGSTPALVQGSWVSLDIPLSDMQAAGLANLTDINQLIFDAAPDGTAVYVDNVYFYNGAVGGGTAPTTSALTPTQDAANVISLYSDAYTDLATTWPTPWSVPNDTTSDVTIDGGLVKEHLNLSFVGVEFASLDASGMTHFHLDVWTPDADSLLVRLVDFGGDGFGGGNDTQGELTFDNASTPALTQGSWVSLDIQLSDLQAAGLASLADLNQIVLDAGPDGTILYVDNLYFYNDAGGGGGTAPTTSAPTPTQDPANVISLYSDAYTDLATTWPTPWSVPNDTTSDVTIDGGLVKEHLNLSFVGVEFASLDASGMTHFHLDVWTPDADNLLLRLVDFGGDGFGGGNDTQGELTYDNASTPALTQGSWVSLDIALSDLQAAGLASLADLNQLVLDPGPDGTIVYVDNVYFYNDAAGGGTAPTTSAPTPTQDAANVISLYSDAYTDLATTWPTPWSVPNDTTSDVTIDGGLVKEHLNLSFVGVEFASLDASGMTHFHVDVWTPDADSLLLRLVDFGGDGFGGGNDTQGELTFDNASTPALTQGSWVSLDIALSDLQAAGLASLTDLNQLVLDAGPDGTILYVDNVYFYDASGATAPTISAPTPTQDAANVISLYSDAYTDVAVTWPTPWSVPNNTTSDVTIDGGLVKEHLNLSFVGVEFASLDASGMTHFHLDVWTPDADSLLLRLVDFGGDGFGGGNDTQGELTFDNASTPALTKGSWVSLDIALSDLQAAGLASLTDLNQLVLDPGPDGTILYIDNVYFYNDVGGGAGGELAVNGDFETGDLTGWTTFDNGGTISVSSPGATGSTFAGNVNVTAPGNPTLKQANLAAGSLTPGQQVTVTFDWKGTDANGGVVDAVLFSEVSGGGVSQTDQILSGGGFPADWTTVGPLNINIGPDVSGGITLQIVAICGGVAGCNSDIFIDNVSIVVP